MLLGLKKTPLILLRHKNWMRSEMRVSLNSGKVQQYRQEKNAGAHFPAPVAFVDPDEIYWVGDGFHRIEADHLNGETKCEVVLRPGTMVDAILHNLRANRESQGLSFGPGDISKSCKILLTDPSFKKYTRKQISEVVGCTYSMVSKVAAKIGLPKINTGRGKSCPVDEVVRLLSEGKSKQEIADLLGVGVRTVYREDVRSQFEDCPHCNGRGKVLKT